MTKTNTRSRIVSILLVLMMMLTMVPITAVTANAADGFVEVSTYEELRSKVNKGSAKIKLMANIDTTNENGGAGLTSTTNLTFKGGGHVLDLNGHTLKLVTSVKDTHLIAVESQDMTIKDSSSSGSGRIEMEFGENLTNVQYPIYISGMGSLTIDGGTFSSSFNFVNYIECYGSLTINGGTIVSNSKRQVNLIKCEDANLTINGGKLQIPDKNEHGMSYGYAVYTENRFGDDRQIVITGGEIDGKVAFTRNDSSATGTPKYNKLPVKITGGVFKQKVYAYYSQKPSGEITEFSPAVELAGGTFKDVYNENLASSNGLATKLTAGTFEKSANIVTHVSDTAMAGYRACLGNSVILRGNECRTAYDWSSMQGFEVSPTGMYFIFREAVVIPDAWGTMSVTLDGNPIDYAKDWKGTVTNIDNGEDHVLKFKWNSLNSALSAAGYTYRANFDCYTVGSNTPTTSVPISATAIEYSYTIPAGIEPSVYPFDLQLNLDKNGSSVGIISNQHIVKLVVDEAPPAPVAHSITVPNGRGTANPTSAMAGETVTVKAKDDTANNMMFTRWNTDTPGVTFADATKQETTFVMPDCDVKVNPGFQQVSFRKQPIDSWPQVNYAGKATVTFSAPITKWELKEGSTTVASSGNLFINTGNPITVDIPKQSSAVEKTYTVVVTANGQKFSSNEFKVSWINWPKAPEVEFTPADGTQFVGEIEVTVSDALYAGEEIFEIAYTTDGKDPKTSTTTIYANTDTEHITLTETTTIKARTYNADAATDAAKWGPLATATFTKYSDSTLPKPTITPEGTTYTGSITAYLTAPALDGVEMEYCLMRTGDPDSIGSWATYDPQTGITVNEFGTITLYARTFKNVEMEDSAGRYYVAHLTSKNASATYTRTYSAAIDDVTVGGKVGKTLTQDVVIRMNGDRFENVTAGEDVSAWFNLPAGLTAKVKELSDANGYHRTLTVTISGMPTATSVAAITVTIPKDKLYANTTTDLTVLSNPKAVYSIALDADHQHDYTGQPYLYLDPGNHYQECTAGDGYNIQAHEFTPWADNEHGKHSRHCTVCQMTDGSTYAETADHTWVWVVDQEAALNQPGKKHEECTGCHAKRNDNTEIPALQDYAVTVTGGTATVAAGTTITRAIEGVEVTVTANAAETGKVFDKWVVKAGGITLANESSDTTTFIMPGNDVKLEATYKAAPSTHTHSYGTDWKYDDTNHWHECECGDKTDTAAHSAGEWIIDTAATETAEGAKHKKCTVCKKVLETATIPATGSSHTNSYGVYVGMTYTAGNLIYQITSIDTATVGQSKVIGVVAAKKNKITKITIPDRADCKGYRLNVTTIGNNAFAGCKALEKLTIGNKVTVIGKNAFKNCSKLETVVIGKAVKTISSKAFIGDNKIKKITFKGDKLKTVKKNAFSKKAKKNIKSKKTKLKGNKKAIKLFKKKLKIK